MRGIEEKKQECCQVTDGAAATSDYPTIRHLLGGGGGLWSRGGYTGKGEQNSFVL